MASRFASNTSKQIRTLAVMWQVWELTHQPLMLGLVGLAEGIPYITTSLFAGHIVDRREKRGLLLAALGGLALCSAGLAALSSAAAPALLGIYGLVALSALCSSLELPSSSSALLGGRAGPPRDLRTRGAVRPVLEP
jgi:MFS family permease